MPINTSGAAGAPLTVYGSWVTDVSPDALPEGVSPDNQEIVYGPGFVGSRPAFQKVTGITFPAVGGVTPTCVYGKSFVLPTGDIKNLYFDSAGRLWVEDLTNSPGTITLLLQSIAGSFCRSLTKFGREYIAISDGLHGTEVPIQYDGTNLDRYTMDGPAAPPSVASLGLPAVQMAASGNTLERNANVVTCNTATAHGLQVGYQAQISNVPDSNATTVNQTNQATAFSVNTSVWNYNSGQYRSLFNPGTSALSDFTVKGFGFNIPATATILGVVIGFGINSQSTTTGTVSQVGLWYSGALEGTAKSPATAITTTITVNNYGSAADLWGAALTPSIVNDPSFGFAAACNCDSIRVFLNAPYTMTVYYTLSGSGTVATVSSIVINNEVNPGLALVTTTQPHGLIPGINISLVGVQPGTVANVSAAQWSAGVTTITTATDHKLVPGSVIQVAGVTTSTGSTTFSFDGSFTVEKVISPVEISYVQTPITATDPDLINATASTGSITVAWPIPDTTPTPTYFEVDSCPSPTTFYIPVTYADGTWTSGSVGFIWEGTFYVTSVPSTTQFTYFQPGPNGATAAVGTVTPFGQAAPGLHLCQVLWLTRQGAITAPSPPVTFIANGGQYVNVTNIPIGPPNVIGRVLAFTGAQPDIPGELPPFYYIPVPAQLEGQVVSTATVINDNTTTSAVLDFSDNTLYAAVGISVPGNTLANQIVLDGALGFSTYLSRMQTWGQRNCIQNLLNMGFEGGVNANANTAPLGWQPSGIWGATGIVTGRNGIGYALQFQQLGASEIFQSAYLDAYGDPIFQPNTLYSVRFWLEYSGIAANTTLAVLLLSSSTGFSAVNVITVTNHPSGSWVELPFNVKTPDSIPSDLFYRTNLNNFTQGTVTVDEISVIYADDPYLDQNIYDSYVNNPEGIDGVSGQWGPQDTAKVMDMGIVRGTLHILTQAPTGKLHYTNGSATSEPSGWDVEPIQGNCGALSAFTLTTSQADDSTEAGGDDWMAWASDVGAMIFGGGVPYKISQEIQPNWNDFTRSDTSVQINMAAAATAWGLNNPASRLLMFGLPIGTATAPNQIYVLNYQHLGSSEAIADSPPFHPSFAGKLIATDNSRKWTHWLRAMNGAARMYRSAGEFTDVFFGGNGQAPGTASGYGNIYTLNPSLFVDDDYGQISPYYVTYAFLDPEKQQMLQIKPGRVLLAFVLAQIQPRSGDSNSQVTLTYFPDNLSAAWPVATTRTLTVGFNKDRNFGGGMAQGDRIFIKIASSPIVGTANSFLLTRFEPFFRNARLLVTGVNQ